MACPEELRGGDKWSLTATGTGVSPNVASVSKLKEYKRPTRKSGNSFKGFSAEEFEKSFVDVLYSKICIEIKEQCEEKIERELFLIDGLSCYECCLVFSSPMHLERHQTFCRSPTPPNVETYILSVDQLREPLSGMLCCPKCPILCCNVPALKRHLSKCREAFKIPIQSKSYSCIECSFQVQRLETLLLHLQLHYFTDLICTPCNRKFISLRSLSSHLKRCSKKETYKCCDCGSSYSDASLLDVHLQTCHQTQCLKCALHVNRALGTDHMMIHLSKEWFTKKSVENTHSTSFELHDKFEEEVILNDSVMTIPVRESTESTCKVLPTPSKPVKSRSKLKSIERKKKMLRKKKLRFTALKRHRWSSKRSKIKHHASSNSYVGTGLANPCKRPNMLLSDTDCSSVPEIFRKRAEALNLLDSCEREMAPDVEMSSNVTNVLCADTLEDISFPGLESEHFEIENGLDESELEGEDDGFSNWKSVKEPDESRFSETGETFQNMEYLSSGGENKPEESELTLTIVNVEGGANFFNWDDECETNTGVDDTEESSTNPLLNGTDNINTAILEGDKGYENWGIHSDINEDGDSGIDATEDRDSNQDRAEDFDICSEINKSGHLIPQPKSIAGKETLNEKVFMCNEVPVTNEIIISNDTYMASSSGCPSEAFLQCSNTFVNKLKPKPYLITKEHNYAVPLGQTLPWFKRQAITNKLKAKERAKNKWQNVKSSSPADTQVIESLVNIGKSSEFKSVKSSEKGTCKISSSFSGQNLPTHPSKPCLPSNVVSSKQETYSVSDLCLNAPISSRDETKQCKQEKLILQKNLVPSSFAYIDSLHNSQQTAAYSVPLNLSLKEVRLQPPKVKTIVSGVNRYSNKKVLTFSDVEIARHLPSPIDVPQSSHAVTGISPIEIEEGKSDTTQTLRQFLNTSHPAGIFNRVNKVKIDSWSKWKQRERSMLARGFKQIATIIPRKETVSKLFSLENMASKFVCLENNVTEDTTNHCIIETSENRRCAASEISNSTSNLMFVVTSDGAVMPHSSFLYSQPTLVHSKENLPPLDLSVCVYDTSGDTKMRGGEVNSSQVVVDDTKKVRSREEEQSNINSQSKEVSASVDSPPKSDTISSLNMQWKVNSSVNDLTLPLVAATLSSSFSRAVPCGLEDTLPIFTSKVSQSSMLSMVDCDLGNGESVDISVIKSPCTYSDNSGPRTDQHGNIPLKSSKCSKVLYNTMNDEEKCSNYVRPFEISHMELCSDSSNGGEPCKEDILPNLNERSDEVFERNFDCKSKKILFEETETLHSMLDKVGTNQRSTSFKTKRNDLGVFQSDASEKLCNSGINGELCFSPTGQDERPIDTEKCDALLGKGKLDVVHEDSSYAKDAILLSHAVLEERNELLSSFVSVSDETVQEALKLAVSTLLQTHIDEDKTNISVTDESVNLPVLPDCIMNASRYSPTPSQNPEYEMCGEPKVIAESDPLNLKSNSQPMGTVANSACDYSKWNMTPERSEALCGHRSVKNVQVSCLVFTHALYPFRKLMLEMRNFKRQKYGREGRRKTTSSKIMGRRHDTFSLTHSLKKRNQFIFHRTHASEEKVDELKPALIGMVLPPKFREDAKIISPVHESEATNCVRTSNYNALNCDPAQHQNLCHMISDVHLVLPNTNSRDVLPLSETGCKKKSIGCDCTNISIRNPSANKTKKSSLTCFPVLYSSRKLIPEMRSFRRSKYGREGMKRISYHGRKVNKVHAPALSNAMLREKSSVTSVSENVLQLVERTVISKVSSIHVYEDSTNMSMTETSDQTNAPSLDCAGQFSNANHEHAGVLMNFPDSNLVNLVDYSPIVNLKHGEEFVNHWNLGRTEFVDQHKSVGERKKVSVLWSSSLYPFQKLMVERRRFRRPMSGRQGLKRKILPGKFACSCCSEWFYSNLDLERHVCLKAILTDKIFNFSSAYFPEDPESTVTNCRRGADVLHKGEMSTFETFLQMKNHLKKRWFYCEKCHARCRTFSALLTHKSAVHTEESSLKCHVCGKEFSRLQKLAVHFARSHNKTDTEPSESCQLQSEMSQKKMRNDSSRFCFEANKLEVFTSSNLSSVSTNSSYMSGTVGDLGKEKGSILVESQKESCGKEIIECNICCRKFNGKSGLVSHTNQVHAPVYKCPLCSRRFTYLSKMKIHFMQHHEPCVSNSELLDTDNSLSQVLFKETSLEEDVFLKSVVDEKCLMNMEDEPVRGKILKADSCVNGETSTDNNCSTSAENTDLVRLTNGGSCLDHTNSVHSKRSDLSTVGSNLSPIFKAQKSKKRKRTKWKIISSSSSDECSPEKQRKPPRLLMCDQTREMFTSSRSFVLSFSKVQKSLYKCGECNEEFKKKHLLAQHRASAHQKISFTCPACLIELPDLHCLDLHLQECADHGQKKVIGYSDKKCDQFPSLVKVGTVGNTPCSATDKQNFRVEKQDASLSAPYQNMANPQGTPDVSCNISSSQQILQVQTPSPDMENSIALSPISDLVQVQVQERKSTGAQPAPIHQNETKVPLLEVHIISEAEKNVNLIQSVPSCDSSSQPSLSLLPDSHDNISGESQLPSRSPNSLTLSNSNGKVCSSSASRKIPRKGFCRCEECHEEFNSKGYLQRHLIKFHGAPKLFNCGLCSKFFTDVRSFRYHQRTKHDKKFCSPSERTRDTLVSLNSDDSATTTTNDEPKFSIVESLKSMGDTQLHSMQTKDQNVGLTEVERDSLKIIELNDDLKKQCAVVKFQVLHQTNSSLVGEGIQQSIAVSSVAEPQQDESTLQTIVDPSSSVVGLQMGQSRQIVNDVLNIKKSGELEKSVTQSNNACSSLDLHQVGEPLKDDPAASNSSNSAQNSISDYGDCLFESSRGKRKTLGKIKKCEKCGRVFRRHVDLTRHKRRQHQKPAVLCQMCGLHVGNYKTLEAHQSKAHPAFNKNAVVLMSDKSMFDSDNENGKKLEEGSGLYFGTTEEKFQSDVSSELNSPDESGAIPSGARPPFKCTDCALIYKTFSCLKRHRIQVHAQPASHYCQVCRKGFSYLHSLEKHVMTHRQINRRSKRLEKIEKCGSTDSLEDKVSEKSPCQSTTERCSDRADEPNERSDFFTHNSPPKSGVSSDVTVSVSMHLDKSLKEDHHQPNISQSNKIHSGQFPVENNNPIQMNVSVVSDSVNSVGNDLAAKPAADFSQNRLHSNTCDNLLNLDNATYSSDFSTVFNCNPSSAVDAHAPGQYSSFNSCASNFESIAPVPQNFAFNFHPFFHSYTPVGPPASCGEVNTWITPFQKFNSSHGCGLPQEHQHTTHPHLTMYSNSVPQYGQYPGMLNTEQAHTGWPNELQLSTNSVLNVAPRDEISLFQELSSRSVVHCSMCGSSFSSISTLQEHFMSCSKNLSMQFNSFC